MLKELFSERTQLCNYSRNNKIKSIARFARKKNQLFSLRFGPLWFVVKIAICSLVYAKHSWDLRSAITLPCGVPTTASPPFADISFFRRLRSKSTWSFHSGVPNASPQKFHLQWENKEDFLLFTFHHHHLWPARALPGWHRCLCIAFCIKNV